MNEFDISRRKLLAGLGTVGLASAGAGLGTSAYFSDEEEFTGNQLTAGTLDIKVGWEEHYSDWSGDEDDGLSGSVEMSDPPGGMVAGNRTGLPANVASLISLQDDADAKQFLDNTQIDQYPSGYDSDDFPTGSSINCDDLSNVALADDDGSGAAPVIDLDDVKPGDFGEVTFSFALCDNPGYVWVESFLESASENGLTEPESEDPDEESGVVELLDEVQVAFWLDDGNNFQNGGEQPLVAGSLRNIINGDHPQINGPRLRIDGRNVASGASTPLDYTSVGVNRFDFSGDGNYDLDFELSDDPAGGSGTVIHGTSSGATTTDYATAVISVEETIGNIKSGSLSYEYYGGADNTNSAPDEVWLLIEETDGTQHVVYHTSNDGAITAQTWETRNVHLEIDGAPDPEDNPGFKWFEVTSGGVSGINNNDGDGNNVADLGDAFGNDATVLAMGIGLGKTGAGGAVSDVYYRNPQLNGNSLGDFPAACFRGDGTVHNGVFAWWLPVDHANEIQTDSATFSLGLYTEQCRHNDGSGMPPEQTSTPGGP
jgi:predicted ribosomally synthesized peptide with SipW-like signal peptide